ELHVAGRRAGILNANAGKIAARVVDLAIGQRKLAAIDKHLARVIAAVSAITDLDVIEHTAGARGIERQAGPAATRGLRRCVKELSTNRIIFVFGKYDRLGLGADGRQRAVDDDPGV